MLHDLTSLVFHLLYYLTKLAFSTCFIMLSPIVSVSFSRAVSLLFLIRIYLVLLTFSDTLLALNHCESGDHEIYVCIVYLDDQMNTKQWYHLR
jgi:hypothetical protein